jgi:long-chain acyl-CoA synthetase
VIRVERFLEASAERFPDKIALIEADRRATYSQLNALADRFANGLRNGGVQRGERVVVFLDNSLEAVAAIYGTLKAGAVFCVVNPMTKAQKLAYILNNCRAAAIVTQGSLLGEAAKAVDQCPSVCLSVVAGGKGALSLRGAMTWEEAVSPSSGCSLPNVGIDLDLAMIIYTSGSTGFPKGVMMTHQNVVFAASSITTYLENNSDDVVLSVLPLAFDYGLYQLLMSCKVGATLVLEKSFAFPVSILKKMAVEKATGFPLVPTMAAMLLQMKGHAPGTYPHLRYLTNTAAALPPSHIERLQELFPKTHIYSMYGLTECKRCTYLPPEQLKIRPASVGIAIPGTEAYIVNEAGERVGPEVVGELVIRGGHVMKGYWEDEEATNRVLRPGPFPWERVLYTGDLFRADSEGYLYFTGRKDDIIKTRGEKVSPKEVENVIYALPGVKEAAVVGVPDSILGMSLRAIIVPAAEQMISERDVMTHCARHLEDFMVPKSVEFRRELPKTDTGKIRRSEVQAEVLGKAIAR